MSRWPGFVGSGADSVGSVRGKIQKRVPAMALTVAATAYGNTVLLTCEGRVVLGEACELRDKVKDALRDGARNLVLDLRGVNYVDSSGIGELVSAYTVTRNSGGELVLAGLQKKVRDLLSITRLIKVFQIFETAEEALEHFRRAAAASAEVAEVIDEPKV